jgi:phenylalanyl-tRNA synthetase beta chain
MGFAITKGRGTNIEVIIPVYRSDILHPIDIVEDVAIAIGYENIHSKLPNVLTFGNKSKIETFSQKLRTILTGLGFTEVTTLTLSNEKIQFEYMNLSGNAVSIVNPITQEHTCLRTSLIPSLLEVLTANKHRYLPQNLFEIGDVAVPKISRKISGVSIHSKANFTGIKSIVESVLRSIDIEYSIIPKSHGSFIPGRCASVVTNREIGYFGEIHPRVITNFKLEYPVVAFELDVKDLMR